MPSRIDTAGHTKAFDYPVAEHWGENNYYGIQGDKGVSIFSLVSFLFSIIIKGLHIRRKTVCSRPDFGFIDGDRA